MISDSPATISSSISQQKVLPAGVYLWLATVPLTWAFNFVALKILYQHFGFTVAGLLTARYILMVPALLLLLFLLEKNMFIRAEHWRYFAVFSLFTVGIYQYLFAKAIELTSAGEAALLISSAPIFTFLITLWLGWERFSLLGLGGVILGFGGISLVIFGGTGSAQIPSTHVLGDVIMIGAAILWAAYAIFSKPLLKYYSPLKVTAWAHALGALLIIPLGWREAARIDWLHLAPLGWICVLYFAWLAGIYGFVIWYRGVRILGSAKTMLFQYLVPPLALIVAYFVLKEVPSGWQLLGVALTLTGVFLASQPQKDTTQITQGERISSSGPGA